MTTSKNRLNALRRLLSQGKLTTQDELRDELENLKFNVTQSTISRDLRRVGAVKATGADGQTVYRLPAEEPGAPLTTGRLSDLIVDMQHNNSMVVIHSKPGSANLIARHLDTVRPRGILGTIAGDDTVFVAVSSEAKATTTLRVLQESLLSLN